MLRTLVLLCALAVALAQDDPSVLLSLEDTPSVSEADVILTVCVSAFGNLAGDERVTLITSDDTAKADADYLPLEVDVEFTEVDSSCYSVTILDDDVVETPEFFSVELTNVVGFQEVLQGEFTISIIPDLDTITVAFQKTSYTTNEGAGQVPICLSIVQGSVDEEKTAGVEVGLSFSAETATAGSDFVDMEPEFVFPQGSVVGNTSCVSVNVIDDRLIETMEQFTVTLDSAEAVSVDEDDQRTVPVYIVDNDEFRLLLHPNTTQDLQEANPGDPAASVELCVTAEAEDGFSLQLSIVVNLNLTGGNADFSDFMLSSNGRLVLTALGETQCSDFMVVNDDVREPNETAILTPMVSGDLIHGDVTNFKILINDDGDTLCRTLFDPSNGKVMDDNRTEGSVATYKCNSGYILSGDSTRECGSDGNWTGQQPQCDLIDCESPPSSSDNGNISFSSTTNGSTAEYTCLDGYVLLGSSVLKCLESGEWSGDAPQCLVLCGNLSNPDNGEVVINRPDDQNMNVEGSNATYSCSNEYNLSGDKSRTCGPDGQWTGSPPMCSRDVAGVKAIVSSTTLVGLVLCLHCIL